MALKYLLGPASADWAARYWSGPRSRGECLVFNAGGDADVKIDLDDSWDDVLARLPQHWRPDAVVVYLAYSCVPHVLWAAPVPLIGLAADWGLLWHGYRKVLPLCERVLTDAPGVEVMRRQGWDHGRPAVLYGVEPAWLGQPLQHSPRDIDVLFLGNLHPAVQRERLAWLGRLARLAGRRVVIRTGVFGDEYHSLLRRSRIAFNRSIRGECNRRVFEAAASGALLFQERGNAETAALFRDGRECVGYGDDDLETLLEHYLTHEGERRRIAEAAHARVQSLGFETLWQDALQRLAAEWPAVQKAVERRPRLEGEAALLARTWEALSCEDPHDPALAADLDAALAARPQAAALHQARGLVAGRAGVTAGLVKTEQAEEAGRWFQRALEHDADDAVAGLNRIEALAASGRKELAVEGARGVLTLLSQSDALSSQALDAGRFPPDFDVFRVEWEKAAWSNAGRPDPERQAKADLLRWRLHGLLAELTGEASHFHEAALARPDLPTGLAALGCALGRAGRPAEAAPHLRRAVEKNPFDRAAARALHHALKEAGDAPGARRLAAERRLMHRAAPEAVPAEPWFLAAAPATTAPVSIVVLCCNELEYTRLCLESVLRRTRPPYELILVDNGSTDGTPAYLEAVRTRPGPARVEVIRNATNVGFPAGCNQGLAKARGRWVVFLNNDTVVAEGWLEGLTAWAARDATVGMVGAVTNNSRPPQQVAVDYDGPEGLEDFAAGRRRDCAGQGLTVQRLTGFCLLARRDVLDEVGGFDERYGIGFFDDDDLSVKVLRAGYGLVVAQDVFVHHFGNRTFASLGVDCPKQLEENLGRFREKWGAAEAAGYRLPTAAAAARANAAASVAPASARPTRMRVSLCLIVKNEEENLPECLRSAADLVDEIVVVDTGSTDRTRELALQFQAKVFDFPWVDDFAAARNESLRHATGEWVFWLDADDRLDDDNRARLKALFASLKDENAAYAMKCLCLPDRATGTATVVDHVRLFRNRPDVRWSYRVHEQILPAVRRAGGEVRWSDVTVHHAGYQDPALRARKLERDLRLLNLEDADRPDDPFTLFNLGSVYHELGKPAEASPRLRRSLEKSHPKDSIVRKLYALIVGCHRLQNQMPEALAACQEGRHVCPDDPELLFLEGLLKREQGDLAGAEASLLQVLEAKPGPHFASVDAGLRGYKARHNLAVVYHQQGRTREAEAQWRLVTKERPDFLPGWLGLGECALKQANWSLLETVARRLNGLPGGSLEAALLRGRGLLARRDFAAARGALEQTIGRFPQELAPRVVLTHVLLQEGRDMDAAERALRDVLALAPGHVEAQRNLDLLLVRRREQQEQAADAVFSASGAPASERQAAALAAADGVEQPLILSAKGEEGRPAAASVRFAVVCIAHDEEVIIDAFLDHYLGHGADAVIVVDNESTDATTDRAGRRPNVTVERLASGELDEELRTATFQKMREACAGKHDWVLLVDCDEFLVPKRGGTLKDALALHSNVALLGTDGWDVVQRAGDPPADWTKPLLDQRRFGIPNPHYDKPVVLRPAGPERLVPGQHFLLGPSPRPSLRPFWLLHFAACDERLFFQRRLKMTARQGLKNIQKAYSIEHTAQTEADVRRRWRSLQNDPRMAPLPTVREGAGPGAAS